MTLEPSITPVVRALALEVVDLSMKVTAQGKFCVFTSFAGHICGLSIGIRPADFDYDDDSSESPQPQTIYLNRDGAEDLLQAQAEYLRMHLT